MMQSEIATLVEKACGHVGIVRESFSEGPIACSQCELRGGKSSVVEVVRRLELPIKSVPEMDSASMESWIRRMIGGKNGA